MNQSINTYSKNSKEPQQKYRLGTVSIKILGGLNRFYRHLTSPSACEALIYLLDNIYIRFGTKLYRQIVGIQMGTNCAPLVADLFVCLFFFVFFFFVFFYLL